MIAPFPFPRPSDGPDDATLAAYLRDIQHCEPLTRAEEAQAAADGEAGRQRLVQANLRFVVAVAKGFQGRGLDLIDLIAAGNLGLMVAADRFDAGRGFKFISFAMWWIRQAIQQAIADHGRTVRVPINRQALARTLWTVAARLARELGRPAALEEIAEAAAVEPSEARLTWEAMQAVVSLDAPLHPEDADGRRVEFLEAEAPSPDACLEADETARRVRQALAACDEREREILTLYFGLGDGEPLTLEEVGAHFGLTRERIRQLKERALAKARAQVAP